MNFVVWMEMVIEHDQAQIYTKKTEIR